MEQPERKFKEIYDVSDYEIWTDTGWKDVDKVCKTVPYIVWELELEGGKVLKCADDHIVFIEDKEVFVKDVKIGDMVDTEDGPQECTGVTNLNTEENMYDVQVEGQRYYSNGILSHNTTTVGVYALWYSLFSEDKIVCIVSNKEKSAKMILRRIKKMYETVPAWLKPGAEEWAKTQVSFDNGSQIITSATSDDAFRGESANVIIMDEFGFVPKNTQNEFWKSNYPTISASEISQIIIVSTPNGMFNKFHQIYAAAEKGRNDFAPMKVTWKRVPGRDEEWKKDQLKNMSKQEFKQEHDCQFLGSTNTVVDSDVLEVLMTEYKDPSFVDMKGKMLIYEKPQQGNTYVIGNDVAKGTGEHYSVSQVLKIVSMKPIKLEQVAVYINNEVDVYTFSDIIDRLSYYYNHAYIMVENNSEGAAVVNRLWWEHENENLANTGSKAINLGIRATRNTKPKAVLLMKKLIEDGSLKLYDRETIEELTSFIEDNGKFYGKDREDDCVSALYWAVYIFEMNILDDSIEFEKKQEDEEDGWGVLTDINTDEIDVDWSWLTDMRDR